jgi:putative ABC transport system permease protein
MSFLPVRIGFFLALRQLWRSSWWTSSLIIFVMVLTFLNLVVVSGILVGLIQGAVTQQRIQFTSDIIVSTLDDKQYIENSPNVIRLIETLPEVVALTPRYREGAVLEANYKTRKDTDKPNTANAQVVGINPLNESVVTGIDQYIIEGEFLSPGDFDQIVVGHFLLSQYIPIESPNFQSLDNVGIGTKIRIRFDDVIREVTVKGILRTKVDDVSIAAFMDDAQLRSLIGRNDGNVDEIAIKLTPSADPNVVRDLLLLNGVGEFAKVQTYEDAQPQFLKDIITTFTMLGTAFSSLGLIVAVITVFIVIFINALTRRKYIGILKGIGISGRAIEFSYMFQSMFYATVGSLLGLGIVYFFLVPYFANNPIDFPFSDGILVAPFEETLFRMVLLVISTIIAGFIPAWMIVRKNTLDSILGRN